MDPGHISVRDPAGSQAQPPRPPPRRRWLAASVIVAALGWWVLASFGSKQAPSVTSVATPEPFPTTTVYHSPLAQGWQQVDLPGAGRLVDVAVWPEGLVAVGDAWGGERVVWLSADGSTWEYAGSPFHGALVTSVSSLPAGLVAIGGALDPRHANYQPAAWVSVDGREWERVLDLPIPAGQGVRILTRVGIVGGRLVASLRTDWPLGAPLVIGWDAWITEDGRSWQPWHSGDEAYLISDIASVGDGYLAGGQLAGRARLWTSGTGGSWTPIEDEEVAWPVGYTFTNVEPLPGGGAVALARSLGSGMVMFQSPDLISWERVPDDQEPTSITWMTSAGGGVVAGTDAPWQDPEGLLWTTDDGLTWEKVGAGARSGLGSRVDGAQPVVLDVLTAPGIGEVAVGTSGSQPTAWLLTDREVDPTVIVPPPVGDHWELVTTLETKVATFASGGEVILARVDSGWLVSDDGRTWEPAIFFGQPPAEWGIYASSAFSGGLVIAGEDPAGVAGLWSSGDSGRTWDRVDPERRVGVYTALVDDGQVIAAFGQAYRDNQPIRAEFHDGGRWEVAEPLPGLQPNSVARVRDGWVGTATTCDGLHCDGLHLVQSSDGRTWSDTTLFTASHVVSTPIGAVISEIDGRTHLANRLQDLSSPGRPVPSSDTVLSSDLAVSTGSGLALLIWGSPERGVHYAYTTDGVAWIEAVPTVEFGFFGANPQTVPGAEGLMVAGTHNGSVSIWEWIDEP